jgi:hypothetical protein
MTKANHEAKTSASTANPKEKDDGFGLEVGDVEKQANFQQYTDMLVRLYQEEFVEPLRRKLDYPTQG